MNRRFSLRVTALAALTWLGCGKLPSLSDGGLVAPGCIESVSTHPLLASSHVPAGSAVAWNSNPPSSGPHYGVWAAYQEFSTPVPRGNYVHDLEHGAVVYLYNCALLGGGSAVDAGTDGGAAQGADAGTENCEALVQGLRDAVAALPDDPRCASTPVRVRAVITPDPLITSAIAASAWGFTYTSECLDLPTLEAFARDHYAHSPEDVCANGATSFGP